MPNKSQVGEHLAEIGDFAVNYRYCSERQLKSRLSFWSYIKIQCAMCFCSVKISVSEVCEYEPVCIMLVEGRIWDSGRQHKLIIKEHSASFMAQITLGPVGALRGEAGPIT